jgi:hypothetical protein
LTQITLLIIVSAGFGRRVSFKEDLKAEPPLGHKLALQPAITTALRYLLLKALIPTWIYSLSSHIHLPYVTPILERTRTSFEAVREHMLEMISLARAWVADGRTTSMDAGLLRNLVEANMSNDEMTDKVYLSDEDLLSDTFVGVTFLVRCMCYVQTRLT